MIRLIAVHAIPTPEAGGLAGRPPVALPDHAGLFLAGDWVGPVGVPLDAALRSAAAAARTAAEHLALKSVSQPA